MEFFLLFMAAGLLAAGMSSNDYRLSGEEKVALFQSNVWRNYFDMYHEVKKHIEINEPTWEDQQCLHFTIHCRSNPDHHFNVTYGGIRSWLEGGSLDWDCPVEELTFLIPPIERDGKTYLDRDYKKSYAREYK